MAKVEVYNQPTAQPTQKVSAAGIGGSVTVLIIYIANQLGLEMSAEVGAAIATVIAFAAGYLVKEKKIVVETEDK